MNIEPILTYNMSKFVKISYIDQPVGSYSFLHIYNSAVNILAFIKHAMYKVACTN